MKTLLTDFRTEFHNRLLDLFWHQWTTLGVAGQTSRCTQGVLDPEALLIASCSVGRHDPRLFDAMLDWLQINGRYTNVQRLQRMLAIYPFAGGAVFSAVAATTSTTRQAVKWARSMHAEAGAAQTATPLFYLPDGNQMPVVHEPDPVFSKCGFLRDTYSPRGAALPFPTDTAANLILRLRALLGVNARCEILAYLLLNSQGSPRAVARACGYYPATVVRALSEMEQSGYIVSRVKGRHRHYTLVDHGAWYALLTGRGRSSSWIVWAPLFSALEQAHLFLNSQDLKELDPLAQASALRRVLKTSIMDNIAASELPVAFGNDKPHTGESLIPFFISAMRQVLDVVHQVV